MVFSSLVFLFLFLALCLGLYFLPLGLSYRNGVLLFFSLGFYFYGEPRLIWVMLLCICVGYVMGLCIHCAPTKKRKKAFLILGTVFYLAFLGFYKYTNFFLTSANRLLSEPLPLLNVIMPIGISFFTFQAMSYLFDVYRDDTPVQKNPLHLALYISMFPQLIAGPIVRYGDVAGEIAQRSHSAAKFSYGITRFLTGLAKKVLLANVMAIIVDDIYAMPSPSARLAWVAAIAYTFQIFYDFSGYSDMAIGLGSMFGFRFLENFDYPYISRSITEFWRRWHMSLGTWFRDYVYIPLGGNRCPKGRQLFNIFVVWFLTGFWHGAAWNFIIWGLFFAVILTLEKLWIGKALHRLPRVVGHVYALVLIVLGWVLFRSPTMTYALDLFATMFSPSGLAEASPQALYYLKQYAVEWVFAIICAVPLGGFCKGLAVKKGLSEAWEWSAFVLRFALFGLVLLRLAASSYNPFIYFRF